MKLTLLLILKRIKLIPFYFGWLLTILGIVIILSQVFFWLEEKIWYPYSLYTVTESLIGWFYRIDPSFWGGFNRWFYHPSRWRGVHSILIGALNFIPLSLFLIVVGSYLESFLGDDRGKLEERIYKEIGKRLDLEAPTLIEFPNGLGFCRCSGRVNHKFYYYLQFSINRITKDFLYSDMEINVEVEPNQKLTKKFQVSLQRTRNKVFQISPSFEIKNKIFPPLYAACIVPSLYVMGALGSWKSPAREKED